MRTVYDIRRENLRTLARQWGGPTSLSRKLGHSNGSYLAQLIGPNPSRDVSEKTARDIENRLQLPTGWMDAEHSDAPRVDDAALSDCVRAVASVLRDVGLRPDPEGYATLVGLVFDRFRLTGRLDEEHTKKLISLMKG